MKIINNPWPGESAGKFEILVFAQSIKLIINHVNQSAHFHLYEIHIPCLVTLSLDSIPASEMKELADERRISIEESTSQDDKRGWEAGLWNCLEFLTYYVYQ